MLALPSTWLVGLVPLTGSLSGGVSPMHSVSLLLSPNTPEFFRTSICSEAHEEKYAGSDTPSHPAVVPLGGSSGATPEAALN